MNDIRTSVSKSNEKRKKEKTSRTILVTGAAGYVGSHCLVDLLYNGFSVVAIDNCVNATEGIDEPNGMPESLRRVQTITGSKLVAYYKVDINEKKSLEMIFSNHPVEAVMHFAGLKAVGESCEKPLEYYRNNISGTITLLEVMLQFDVRRMIFSSSATVYGSPKYLPIDEQHHTGRNCTNPYGRTKYFIEEILKDLCTSKNDWNVISLRYFNPVGAHQSGEIGEDPQGVPNNLMPYISQVAVGRRPLLKVFGNDFKTTDGTGVRDYIHIMDLASGHLSALNKLFTEDVTGWHVYNLGAGKGYSVLDVITAFEKSTGVLVPYKIFERRSGDVDEVWADISEASRSLNWRPTKSLTEMCAHTWKWQSKNPMGYRKCVTPAIAAVKEKSNNDDCKNSIKSTYGESKSVPFIGEKAGRTNGKKFVYEVNNNDEDIAAFE